MNGTDALHPPHHPVPLHPVATDVVAQWPPGTFLENLALDSDGESWLVTSPFNQTIHRVRADGIGWQRPRARRTWTGQCENVLFWYLEPYGCASNGLRARD
jgi:hypothetical protein